MHHDITPAKYCFETITYFLLFPLSHLTIFFFRKINISHDNNVVIIIINITTEPTCQKLYENIHKDIRISLNRILFVGHFDALTLCGISGDCSMTAMWSINSLNCAVMVCDLSFHAFWFSQHYWTYVLTHSTRFKLVNNC